MANFQKAKDIAEEVLKENFIQKPPIPVAEIAKNYGFDVFEVQLSPDIAGFVDMKKHLIYVNLADTNTRKAFTIAHELGHIKLHSELLKKNPNIGILYRRPLGKKDDNEQEQEANYFAACLLVPQSMLKKVKEEYKQIIGKDFDILSSLFAVSPEVMSYRLRDCYIKEDLNE